MKGSKLKAGSPPPSRKISPMINAHIDPYVLGSAYMTQTNCKVKGRTALIDETIRHLPRRKSYTSWLRLLTN